MKCLKNAVIQIDAHAAYLYKQVEWIDPKTMKQQVETIKGG
jgi:hypothetical protein